MSKSYGNIIEIFAPEKELKKQIMGVVTDSTPLESPKDPSKDNVYKLYSYFASEDEKNSLTVKYRAGGFGYGDAKKLLLEKVLDHFKPFREKREELKNNLDYVKSVLKDGRKSRRSSQNTKRSLGSSRAEYLTFLRSKII
jgi:tryptophanyl-tRNA synthetase